MEAGTSGVVSREDEELDADFGLFQVKLHESLTVFPALSMIEPCTVKERVTSVLY